MTTDVRSPARSAVEWTGSAGNGGQGAGAMNKVARVTLVFWIMKMCATTLGESAWEHAAALPAGFAQRAALLVVASVLLLAWQFRGDRFHPVRYWLVVLATGAIAAMAADAMGRGAWPGYAGGSLLLAAALGATLGLWLRVKGSVAPETVTDPRSEAFYWTAIVLANALGTGIADGFASASSLGLGTEVVLVGGLVAVVVLAAYFTHFDLAVLFWIAIVFTRPFGATFGDFLSSPNEAGGLDLGTARTALVQAVLLVAFLVYSRAEDARLRRAGG